MLIAHINMGLFIYTITLQYYIILYSFSIDLNITYLSKHMNTDILEYMKFQNNHIFFLLPFICW